MEMNKEISNRVRSILDTFDPDSPKSTADSLREFWMTFEPKSIGGFRAELREQQETLGIPVPVLKSIGKELSKSAIKNVDDSIPLARLLWDEYGREGRVVAAIALGAMELVEPARIVILLKELCRTCITWEDADRLAMDALEPIVRKEPEDWIGAIEPWLGSKNKWIRRAGVTVLARLPMKQPYFTERCLELIEPLLADEEVDVRKAVSFAIRLSVRGELGPVKDFLGRNVPPENPNSTWILCDAIRSMTKKFLPEFAPLLPQYEAWAKMSSLHAKDRRSVESAVRILQSVQT
jgi:3-methyladenine DNA glycosylase AlkD